MTSTKKRIDSFTGRFEFLSNFHFVNVEYEGDEYRSVEHAYQAAKTLDPVQRAKIRACQTPAIAKKMGRRVRLRPDWETVKVDIMKMLLLDKFAYEDLAARLLETGDAELVEGNWWGDTFYGVYYPPRGEPIGQNVLGKLLMEIRSSIRDALK